MTDENNIRDDLEAKIFTSITGTGSTGEPGQSDQDEAQPQLSNGEIVAAALAMGRDVFCTFTDLQSPQATLDDSKTAMLGDAWGKVLDKRGINLHGYLGDYMLEIAAAMSTFAVARAVHAGVKAELSARQPVEVKAEESTEPEHAVVD